MCELRAEEKWKGKPESFSTLLIDLQGPFKKKERAGKKSHYNIS